MVSTQSMKRSLIALAALLLLACTVSPTGRKQFILPNFTDSEVSKMGISAYDDLKKKQPLSKDAGTNAYVNCVAKAILASLPGDEGQGWEINVFQDDTPNAFALPGKKIGVHSGILKVAENQDQLATVIGHEIGHVRAHHSAERLSQQFAAQGALVVGGIIAATSDSPQKGLAVGALGAGITYGVLLPFSRTQESEADMIGLRLMADAGFNPDESVALWQNMAAADKSKTPEFMSTHPSDQTRMAALNRALPMAEEDARAAQQQGRHPNCKR
ncbi:MAG: peptidase [Verrucomicrobiaceae bacterium]|nr:peptidase [Verrucomicrobiaceae bacterium]